MISPIGYFLATFSAPLDTAVASGSTALATWVAPIAGTTTALYYLIQAVKWQAGDTRVAHNFVPQLVRIVVTLALCSNATFLQQWVIMPLYHGLASAIITALAGSMGANSINIYSGLNAAAAAFDSLWDMMIGVVATIWGHAGMFDWAAYIGGVLTAIACGLCIIAMAVVYFMSNLLLAIIMIGAAPIIACGLSERLQGVVDRALGKVLSLVLLQVATVIVLQIEVTGDQVFMGNILAAINAPGPSLMDRLGQFFSTTGDALAGASTATELMNLAAMVVWFFAGALALYFVPAIAYSIGTGVTTSAVPILLGATAAARYLGGRVPAIPSTPPAGQRPNLGVTLDRATIAAELARRPPLSPSPPLPPPPPLNPSSRS